jgi:hypothetical protein
VLRTLLSIAPRNLVNRLAAQIVGNRAFTLLLPSDAAFRNAGDVAPALLRTLQPDAAGAALLAGDKLALAASADVNATALAQLLAAHLVPGAALRAADLRDGQTFKSALGAPLQVRRRARPAHRSAPTKIAPPSAAAAHASRGVVLRARR